MAHRVILELPDALYERVRQAATDKGQSVEAVVVEALAKFYPGAHRGDVLDSDSGKHAYIAAAIEATDWWDAEGDREWDRWQP